MGHVKVIWLHSDVTMAMNCWEDASKPVAVMASGNIHGQTALEVVIQSITYWNSHCYY